MLPINDTDHLSELSTGAQGTAGNGSHDPAADTSSHEARQDHHGLLEPMPALVETLPSRRSTISTPVSQIANNPPSGTARGRGRARSYAVTDYPAGQPPSSIAGHSLPLPVYQELPYEQFPSRGFTLNL